MADIGGSTAHMDAVTMRLGYARRGRLRGRQDRPRCGLFRILAGCLVDSFRGPAIFAHLAHLVNRGQVLRRHRPRMAQLIWR
jgi:hypothetical protein